MVLATTFCVLSLIAQAVNLFVAVFVRRTTTDILIVVLIIETLPALLFLFLFAREESISSPIKTFMAASSSRSFIRKTSLHLTPKTGFDSNKGVHNDDASKVISLKLKNPGSASDTADTGESARSAVVAPAAENED